jgi:hypothetical protein
MKYLILLIALAQVPLRAATTAVTDLPVGSIIPVPVVATNGGFFAYWYPPSSILRTNNIYAQPVATVWAPEVSTDGVNWAGNRFTHSAYLPLRDVRALHQPCLTCLNFIQVTNNIQVRIRLVSY